MKASHPSCEGGRDLHDQLLKERISSAEKHLARLCAAVGGYACKTAALRDKGDEVAVGAHHFADTEEVSVTLKAGLEDLATTLCGVGDYRDAEVMRLEARVVAPLSRYEETCRNAREVFKSTLAARDHEMARRRYLCRLRETNPRLTQQIAQAETELSKASVHVSRASKTLREHVERFEQQKLHDIRAILLEFVTVELSFNTKAVELFTKAYQDVAKINVEQDLEGFRQAVHFTEPTSRLAALKITPPRKGPRFLSSLFSAPSLFRRADASRVNESPGRVQGNKGSSSALKIDNSSFATPRADDMEVRSIFQRFQVSPRARPTTKANQRTSWPLEDKCKSTLNIDSQTSTNRSGDDAEDESSLLTPDDGQIERLGKCGSYLYAKRLK